MTIETWQENMNGNTVQLAAEYDSVSSAYFQNRLRDDALSLIDFEKNDDVLDVGCGPGKLCKYLSPLVNSVIGLDISPGMIELARQKNSAANVRFFEDDAQTFGDHLVDWREKFNKIVCLTVLHWCKDQEGVLRNIFQCLRPGGTFLLGFGLRDQLHGKTGSYGETGEVWIREHPKWGSFLKDHGYQVVFKDDRESFLERMKSIGFTIQTAKTPTGRWVQWNEKILKAQLRLIFHPITQIPAELQDECIDDVYEWLCDVTPKRPNGFFEGEIGRYEFLTVLATKE